MNHDRQFRVHRLLGYADLLEHDAETRRLIRELDPETPDEWFAAKASLVRELAWAVRDAVP